MSTKEEQIALMNAEKTQNNDEIVFINQQITGLNQAITEQTNNIASFNTQITDLNTKIEILTANNVIIDDVISIIEAS